jgi:hypothetical protein
VNEDDLLFCFVCVSSSVHDEVVTFSNNHLFLFTLYFPMFDTLFTNVFCNQLSVMFFPNVFIVLQVSDLFLLLSSLNSRHHWCNTNSNKIFHVLNESRNITKENYGTALCKMIDSKIKYLFFYLDIYTVIQLQNIEQQMGNVFL